MRIMKETGNTGLFEELTDRLNEQMSGNSI